jgi:hypothetical protein
MRHLSTLSFCAFTGILLAAPAHAESLADRIQSINSGTHQGVVIYKDKPDDAAAPATNPDGTPVEKPTGWRALFSKIPRPAARRFPTSAAAASRATASCCNPAATRTSL